MKLDYHSGNVVVVRLSRRNVMELYRQVEYLDAGDFGNTGLSKVIGEQIVHVTIEGDQEHYGKDLAKVRDFNYGRGRGRVQYPGAPKRRGAEGVFDRLKAAQDAKPEGHVDRLVRFLTREDYHTDEV